MKRQNGQIYEFADFRLIPEEGLLLRNGIAVPLTPKAFSALVILVEQHGHLVEKSELIERIWDNAFVEEAAVSRCVWGIRNALGEDPKKKEFIQTVPKRGYRFIADVVEKNGSNRHDTIFLVEPVSESVRHLTNTNVMPIRRPNFGSQTHATDTQDMPETVVSMPLRGANGNLHVLSAPKSVPRFSRFYTAGILTLLLLGVAGVYFFLSRPSAAGNGLVKVAVLPLKPVSAENRDTIVEFAIAESLILKMSTAPNLYVRPLSAVRKYVELDRDPIDAGNELNADYVLSSNYQIVDGRIRVTSQLFDTRTGKTEATYRSESEAGDKFAMQDSIANEIGNAVFARLGHSGNVYTANRGTENEEAYRLYLQGQYLVDKKTQSDAERAIEIFDEALALDPNFAHAWAGKAGAHCTFAHMGGIEPKLAFATAKPALNKAFELDPNLAEAHAVLGIISFDYDWEFEKGLRHFRKAFEINPQHEMARRWYANRLALLGRYDEALTEIKAVIDINPSSLFHQWDLAHILYQSRRYDEAIVQLHRVLEMDPNMAWAPNLIWVSYHMKGEHEQAYQWFMKLRGKGKSDPADIEVFKKTYAQSGWNGVLLKFSELRRSRYKHGQYDPSSSGIALAASLVGDKETAFKFAADGLKYRGLWVPYLLHDPAFELLQKDPRFEKHLSEGGLPITP